MSMGMNEATATWQQELGAQARRYLESDNQIKQLVKQLKPVRESAQRYKEIVSSLMVEHREHVGGCIDVHDYGASICCQPGTSKRVPSKDVVRDRCIEYCGDAERGQQLFDRLMEKEEVPCLRFRRRPIKPDAQAADKNSVAADKHDGDDDDFADE